MNITGFIRLQIFHHQKAQPLHQRKSWKNLWKMAVNYKKVRNEMAAFQGNALEILGMIGCELVRYMIELHDKWYIKIESDKEVFFFIV